MSPGSLIGCDETHGRPRLPPSLEADARPLAGSVAIGCSFGFSPESICLERVGCFDDGVFVCRTAQLAEALSGFHAHFDGGCLHIPGVFRRRRVGVFAEGCRRRNGRSVDWSGLGGLPCRFQAGRAPDSASPIAYVILSTCVSPGGRGEDRCGSNLRCSPSRCRWWVQRDRQIPRWRRGRRSRAAPRR